MTSATIVGRIVREAQITTKGDVVLAKTTIASDRSRGKNAKTDFLDVVAFGDAAGVRVRPNHGDDPHRLLHRLERHAAQVGDHRGPQDRTVRGGGGLGRPSGPSVHHDATRDLPLSHRPCDLPRRTARHPVITAWQSTALPEDAPERLVRFGRTRFAITLAVLDDAAGVRIEARVGRRLVTRIRCDRADTATTLVRAAEIAAAEVPSSGTA